MPGLMDVKSKDDLKSYMMDTMIQDMMRLQNKNIPSGASQWDPKNPDHMLLFKQHLKDTNRNDPLEAYPPNGLMGK